MRHVWLRREMHRVRWWGKPVGKRPLGRPRSRWEDNIKMDLNKIGWEGMEWINLAVVNTVMKLWIT
jgi:hypothetical protein